MIGTLTLIVLDIAACVSMYLMGRHVASVETAHWRERAESQHAHNLELQRLLRTASRGPEMGPLADDGLPTLPSISVPRHDA